MCDSILLQVSQVFVFKEVFAISVRVFCRSNTPTQQKVATCNIFPSPRTLLWFIWGSILLQVVWPCVCMIDSRPHIANARLNFHCIFIRGTCSSGLELNGALYTVKTPCWREKTFASSIRVFRDALDTQFTTLLLPPNRPFTELLSHRIRSLPVILPKHR